MLTGIYAIISNVVTDVVQVVILYYLQRMTVVNNQRKLHETVNNGFDKAAQFAQNGCGVDASTIIGNPEIQAKFVMLGTNYVKQYISDALVEAKISTDKDFQDRLLARIAI